VHHQVVRQRSKDRSKQGKHINNQRGPLKLNEHANSQDAKTESDITTIERTGTAEAKTDCRNIQMQLRKAKLTLKICEDARTVTKCWMSTERQQDQTTNNTTIPTDRNFEAENSYERAIEQ